MSESAYMTEDAWYVVDHDRDDEIVRGPYAEATTAGAVRAELERSDDYYRESGNLWIVLGEAE